jgi:hypothetical protein
MRLGKNPKLKWQGKPVRNPSAWNWIHTIRLSRAPRKIENRKLVSARVFADRDGTAAIEISVAFEGVTCSTILRLDDADAIISLSQQLNQLRGVTLKQIGEMEMR